jgi:hypothetical protein
MKHLVLVLCLLAARFGAALGLDQAAVAKETPATLRLTSPQGGDRWCADSHHYITWRADGLPADSTVKIAYTADGGKTWHELAATPAKSGRYLWKVPNRLAAECKVRIQSAQPQAAAENALPFAIIPSQEVRDYEWKQITARAPFAPRDGAGALVMNGRLWFLGGWNPQDKKHFPRICNNEVWSSRDGVAWTLDKPNTFLDDRFDAGRDWEGRHTAGYAVLHGKMWIVGGDVNQGHYHFDVWNSADGKSWVHVNKGRPVPWGPRALHYTVAFQDRLWVMGGQTIPTFAAADEVFCRDIWNSADGVRWDRVAAREPYWSPRGMIGGSAVFKGRIWILGGGTYDTPRAPTRLFYNDVWSSPDGRSWQRQVELAPWQPRQYHDVAVFDERLWVLEGYGGGNRNDVWYSVDGLNWYELPHTPWKPRHAASVFVHDGALWMVAGNNMQSDVWALRRKLHLSND